MMHLHPTWHWALPCVLLACGGEVDARQDVGDASVDAPSEHRVFRDPCFYYDAFQCLGHFSQCLWTTPDQCNQIPAGDQPPPPLADAGTRLMTDGYCFPRKTCTSDTDCDGAQRCLNALYGQCGYGGGCLSSPYSNCSYVALCVAPDDP